MLSSLLITSHTHTHRMARPLCGKFAVVSTSRVRGRPRLASEAHPARLAVLNSKRSTEQYASAPDLACFKARTGTAEPRHPHTGNRPCPPAPTSYGQQPTTLWASLQQSRTTYHPMCGSLARAFRRRHRVASPLELGSRRTLRSHSRRPKSWCRHNGKRCGLIE